MRNCRTLLRTSLHPPTVWLQPVQSTATKAEKMGMPVEASKYCENQLSSHAKIFSAEIYLYERTTGWGIHWLLHDRL